jgi:hypothetical protein
MATIEANLTYMGCRLAIWLAATVAQIVFISRTRSFITKQPRMLSALIASSTGLFAVRDSWIVIWVASRSLATLYIEGLLDSASSAAFLVRYGRMAPFAYSVAQLY